MSAPNPASAANNRFRSLTPASLSRAEKSSVISLALSVLSQRSRPALSFATPEDIQRFVRLRLAGRRDEAFGIVYLNTRHRLIEMEEMFTGAVDKADVSPRTVVRKALQHNAAALILFHNHPSGVAEPGEADRDIATKLGRALELIDVRLLDHLVINDDAFVSLAERGFI